METLFSYPQIQEDILNTVKSNILLTNDSGLSIFLAIIAFLLFTYTMNESPNRINTFGESDTKFKVTSFRLILTGALLLILSALIQVHNIDKLRSQADKLVIEGVKLIETRNNVPIKNYPEYYLRGVDGYIEITDEDNKDELNTYYIRDLLAIKETTEVPSCTYTKYDVTLSEELMDFINRKTAPYTKEAVYRLLNDFRRTDIESITYKGTGSVIKEHITRVYHPNSAITSSTDFSNLSIATKEGEIIVLEADTITKVLDKESKIVLNYTLSRSGDSLSPSSIEENGMTYLLTDTTLYVVDDAQNDNQGTGKTNVDVNVKVDVNTH